jgi:E3 ubiquitin-protein ligase Topors
MQRAVLQVSRARNGEIPDVTDGFDFRDNPAQTHRLIPWLNRELVVLLPQNHTSAIPQILEDMRENFGNHDIQSREIHDYFLRYLHNRTDHFIHELYNFAISPYDIVGYDRNVDYNPRTQSAVATVEISSNESSDGEVQVIDDGSAGSSSAVHPQASTEVVLETAGSREQSCIISDVNPIIAENVPPASSEVVVESSDSECQFVLALKPPHLRTPEQVSLDSASDSDVVFIPNANNGSTDSEDNKPLAETMKQLKSETVDAEDKSGLLLNFGASTSTDTNPRKLYYHPIRKRSLGKSIFESSSSDSSSSSESSDDDWESKKRKSRKKSSKALKKRRVTASTSSAGNTKPLSELPSSEEAREEIPEGQAEGDEINEQLPRVKSVIIKKCDDQHYIQKSSESEMSSE